MPEVSRHYELAKRSVDIVISALGLFATAPIQAAVVAAVIVSDGKPVFFRQERPGKDAKVFELVKFRTMRPIEAGKVTDGDRLTSIGRFLRSTSLDELPTLWNVLKGDMSLVGPRPLLVEYLPRYSGDQARRHEVRPGVTGLAQVSGRNALTWEDKFAIDVEYVDTRSFALDVRILVRTISAVVSRHGVSEDGHVTMSEFTG